jgi:hypothetical protein
VRVVPNPYYAFSEYERAPDADHRENHESTPSLQHQNFQPQWHDGKRSYTKNSDSPEQTWDLKNHAGVPIASGAYLIHVDGFELGETIVKLFHGDATDGPQQLLTLFLYSSFLERPRLLSAVRVLFMKKLHLTIWLINRNIVGLH